MLSQMQVNNLAHMTNSRIVSLSRDELLTKINNALNGKKTLAYSNANELMQDRSHIRSLKTQNMLYIETKKKSSIIPVKSDQSSIVQMTNILRNLHANHDLPVSFKLNKSEA